MAFGTGACVFLDDWRMLELYTKHNHAEDNFPALDPHFNA